MLSVSYATCQINHNDDEPRFSPTLDGRVATAYTGGCLLVGSGGTAAAWVTREIVVPVTGKRM